MILTNLFEFSQFWFQNGWFGIKLFQYWNNFRGLNTSIDVWCELTEVFLRILKATSSKLGKF